jgi:hypothetical protein
MHSNAEWRIFEALCLQLGVTNDSHGAHDTDEYIVFHGVKWFSTQENGGSQPYREMDFLIVSRRHGLLIVEAKAAKIALSTGRGVRNATNLNVVHDAYFDQAKTLEDELTRFLAEAPLTSRHMASYRIGAAVWFPFSQPWPRDDRTTRGVPNTLILDSVDLGDPGAGLLRVYDYLGQKNGSTTLSDEAIDALIATLNKATLTMQARLSVRIPGAEERIDQLTLDQYEVLEALSDFPRLEVRGAAGTGKTVLAYEKAFRLAREGKRVLYLCSNPALSRCVTTSGGQKTPTLTSSIFRRSARSRHSEGRHRQPGWTKKVLRRHVRRRRSMMSRASGAGAGIGSTTLSWSTRDRISIHRSGGHSSNC